MEEKSQAQRIAEKYIINYRLMQFTFALVTIPALFGYKILADRAYNALTSVLCTLALVAVIVFMFRLRIVSRNKQDKKIIEILDVDCDPVLFTDVYKLLHEKRIFRKSETLFMINIAHGLNGQGMFTQANEILEELSHKNMPDWQRLSFYNTTANCAKALNDFRRVQWALSGAEQVKKRAKPASRMETNSATVVTIIKSMLLAHEGQIGAAIELSTQLLSGAALPIQRVTRNFNLASYLYMLGDFEKAKPCLEYVIKNGNKLYIVVAAKEMLTECEKQIG